MAENRLAEPILRRLRFRQTIKDMRRFDDNYRPGQSAGGQEFYNLRSAMDLRPTAGREISHKAIRQTRGGMPTEDQARQSTFVAFDEIQACVEGLRRDGVYVFQQQIPEHMVTRMRESALAVDAEPRGLEVPPAPYPRQQPTVGRYDINEDNTMASADMQDYCSDPALALIAARYLEQPVIQDQTALWWTTPNGGGDESLNAWLFHQDRDRASFLKFFCYLTDVSAGHGPHTVVRGTHRNVPPILSTDGRKDDDLVRSAGLWDKVIELTGKAGTFMAVDTVGLHKGTPPVDGDRCVLQVEFSTSLFGAPVDYPVFSPSPLARERYRQMPEILQRWYRAITPE